MGVWRLLCFPIKLLIYIFNRPGVVGAVLQTPLSLIQRVSQLAFSSKSSKYHKSQTVGGRGLKFWKKIHPPQHITCHVSHVTCHVSPVTCHMSHFFLSWKVVKLIGGGFVINKAYPCQLRDLFFFNWECIEKLLTFFLRVEKGKNKKAKNKSRVYWEKTLQKMASRVEKWNFSDQNGEWN